MKTILSNITLVLAAAFLISGCELNDGGGLKLIPPGGVERAVGEDATLKSLAVENFSISPAFDAETLEYTLVVSKATTSSLTVRAIGPDGADVTLAINGGSSVPVTGPVYSTAVALEDTLDVNDIVVSVTSEDALSTNEYHIRVYFLGTSASLSGLAVSLTNGSPGAISSDIDPVFDPAHLVYGVGISYATTSIDITVSMPEGSGMTATVDGWTALSGSPVPITSLPGPGASREITITVTSQDESATRDYTLTIIKGAAPSTENRLKYLARGLKVWGVWYNRSISPDPSESNLAISWLYESSDGGWLFSSISDYRVDVRPLDASIQGITVNGNTCTITQVDGIDTYRCTLSRSSFSGYNIVLPIVVTAESGDTRTYTLTIKD
ncbi:MAG: cadherin-like beta sandwich domain-containing protein [Spirochaetes bacterium]|nr:cadherin-like beta sandwich domain-containing protein [Spirochaetota bacterium]